jgi:transcriptional regulator with XRE-family HTH domain
MPQPPGLIPDGPELRRLRLAREIRVTDLARQIGCHRQTLWNIEGSNAPVGAILAIRISRALGIKPSDWTTQPGGDDDELDGLLAS